MTKSDIKVYLTCNWADNEFISDHWESKLDKSIPIVIVRNRDDAEYDIVFNKPWHKDGDENLFKSPTRTILIRMEPNMARRKDLWGDFWSDPPRDSFVSVIEFPTVLNFVEWHVAQDYDTLYNTDFAPQKTMGNAVSVIVSDRYFDIGQIRRVDFVKYLQDNYSDKIDLHVYGRGDLAKWGIKDHRGTLPVYNKDKALIPYKYHFNAENSFTYNYITEKFYDPVMVDTLVFYSGAINAMSVYPKQGFVCMDLDDFQLNAEIMVKCIEDNEYERQRPQIQQLKRYILETKTFSVRIYDIIQDHKNKLDRKE